MYYVLINYISELLCPEIIPKYMIHTHTHTHTHRKLQRITIVLTHVPPPLLTVVLPAAEIITSVETLVLVTPSQMH